MGTMKKTKGDVDGADSKSRKDKKEKKRSKPDVLGTVGVLSAKKKAKKAPVDAAGPTAPTTTATATATATAPAKTKEKRKTKGNKARREQTISAKKRTEPLVQQDDHEDCDAEDQEPAAQVEFAALADGYEISEDEPEENEDRQPDSPRAARRGKRQQPELKLEGVLVGEDMYLVDKASGAAYSMERGSDGKLLKVGKWDGEKVVEEEQEAQEGTGEEDTPGSPSDSEEEDGNSDAEPTDGNLPGKRRGVSSGVLFPFTVDDDDDHCETSPEAYGDIEGMLGRLAQLMGKERSELAIYDPYYCSGQVVANLGRYGFTSVYNKCEDFYKMQEVGKVPEHDVIVTNPPYSAHHMESIIRFCCEQGKPWFLLLPNYVYRKEYFDPSLRAGAKPTMPFFLAPTQRYYYWSPKGLNRSNPKVRGDGRTSPFVSFWYCHMARWTEDLCQWWNKELRGREGPGGRRVVLARSPRQLPLGCMDDFDPNRKKKKDRLDKAKTAAQRGRGRGRGSGRGRGGGAPGKKWAGDKGKGQPSKKPTVEKKSES